MGEVKKEEKIDRRKYIKYIGTGAALAVAAAIGYGVSELTRPPPPKPTTVVTTITTLMPTPTPTLPVKKKTIKYTNIFNVQSEGARIFSTLMTEKFNARSPTHEIDMSLNSYTYIVDPILLGEIKAGTHPLFVDSVDHYNGQYIVMDAVVPLDEFLDKYPEIKRDNWILSIEEKTFKPYEEKYGFKYWCLPFGTTYESFFFVRTDLLKEAGYTMDDVNRIKSIDDIREIGKALTKPEKGIWGFELCGTRWDITDTIWPQWAIAQDKKLGNWLSEDWSESYVNQWPWVEAMKAHIDFVYNSKISSPASIKEGDEVVTELLMSGKVAMTQTEFVNIGVIMDRDRTLAKTKQPQFLKSGTIQFAPGPDMGSGIRGWLAPYGFIMLKRPEATKEDYEAVFEYMASWLTQESQMEIQKLTGLFPASISAADTLLKKSKELMEKGDYSLQCINAMWPLIKDTLIPAPPFPAFVAMVYDIQATWGEKAWLREIPVQEAMDNAAKEINELCKKFGYRK